MVDRLKVGFFLLVLLVPSHASAASFRLDTAIVGQVRENTANQNEVPVNGYLGLGFAQPKWNFSGETDMRLFRDFPRKIDEYDLYQAVLHFQPLPILKIDFGRQFVSEGFFTTVLDGLKTTIMPAGYVDITVYGGIPRSVEIGDFHKDDGLMAGMSVGLKNVPRTNAQIHAAWRKNDASFKDFVENDEVFVGANLSHQLDVITKPLFYGLVEYNIAGKNLDAATAGVDFTPAKWAAVNLEFNLFDVNRASDRRTILALFTQGRTLSGRFGSTWTILPDWLDFVANYSYQRLEIQNGVKRNGHLLDTAFQISYEEIGLHVEPGYYFSDSFGGRVNGGRLSVHEQFTEKIDAELYCDFAKYRKITNKNGTAFSTVVWAGYEVVKGLTLSGGFEYNRNTVFTKDIRGSFKIGYRFDHGS